MSDPDQIRQEIERTRAELSSDVDALADKVSPTSIAHRQVETAKGAVSSVKEKVMGKASDAKSAVQSHTPQHSSGGPSVSDRASSAKSSAQGAMQSAQGAVQSAPGMMKQQAQGNPLAAGLIAFGAGWLVSSLLPATAREQQAASQLEEKATSEPVKQKLAEAAHSVQDQLREPAMGAMESLKSTAQDAAQTVKGEAQQASVDVREQASQAKTAVQQQATSS